MYSTIDLALAEFPSEPFSRDLTKLVIGYLTEEKRDIIKYENSTMVRNCLIYTTINEVKEGLLISIYGRYSEYSENYLGGKKHGPSIKFHNGPCWDCVRGTYITARTIRNYTTYKNGLLHGLCIEVFTDGSVSQKYYKNGLIHGYAVIFEKMKVPSGPDINAYKFTADDFLIHECKYYYGAVV